MVEKKTATLQISEDDVAKVKEELATYTVEVEEEYDEIKFSLQSNNVFFDVTLLVIERMSEEDRMFAFNTYPLIHSFDDIQMKLFGRIIWNWR